MGSRAEIQRWLEQALAVGIHSFLHDDQLLAAVLGFAQHSRRDGLCSLDRYWRGGCRDSWYCFVSGIREFLATVFHRHDFGWAGGSEIIQ